MSQVVIDDIIPRTQLVATAGQTVFNTNWTADATTDVLVYARAENVEPDDATQLVPSSDYNVTLIGASETVRVTFLVGRTLDDVITIVRDTPADRMNLYINTNFTPSMLNQDFSILTLVDQQAQMYDQVINPGYNVSATIEDKDKILPILGPQQVWRMNAAGTEIEATTIDTDDIPAPSNADYWVSKANAALDNEVNLGALTTGLLKHSVTAGYSTPATATPGTDYWAPGNALTRTQVPTADDDVTNKLYVDAVAAGFHFINPVLVATTANFSSTYDNGTSGVGATLTASSNGAASIDGVSLSLNDRVLFQFQTNTFENGIYFVSQVGDGSTPAIYTRATDFDEPSEIQQGDFVPVQSGSTYARSAWVQTAVVTTIGVDAITFILFVQPLTNVVTIDGTQTITGEKTFDANVALDNGSTLDLNSTTPIDSFLDEDDMASDSNTSGATQQSIKAYVDNEITGATKWVLLQTADVNAVASIEFTDLSLQYFAYKILMDYVIPVTDGVGLAMDLSIDNGATWINGGSNYRSIRNTTLAASNTPTGSNATGSMSFVLNTGNTSFSEGIWGEITVYYPMQSATRCTLTGHIFQVNSSGVGECVISGHQRLNNEANNAMRLLFASGNIASANVRLYGIRRS